METLTKDSDHEKRSKDIIAWNIAYSQGSLNIYSMEANSFIAKKKREINHLHRRYLAGKAQMEYQFGDPAFDDSAWEKIANNELKKRKYSHEEKIKRMTDDYNKKSDSLKKEISELQKKIFDLEESIKESNSMINENKQFLNFGSIGNFDLLKNEINDETRNIQNLENIQSQISQNNGQVDNFMFFKKSAW